MIPTGDICGTRRLSRKFLDAVAASDEPLYRMATSVGLHPSTASRWRNGHEIPSATDQRLLLLAVLLNVDPGDIFEVSDDAR
jgi:hypothetical protein